MRRWRRWCGWSGSRCARILLEGRIFDAAEAKEKRLVTRVVPDDQVADEVRATAQRIADGALVARWHKKFARRMAEGSPPAAELDECFDCFDTEDFRIGYAAFLAKQNQSSPADERTVGRHARARTRADHGGPTAG